MLIRNMKETDLKDVAVLYEELSGRKSSIESMSEKFSSMSENENYILIVAEEQGKAVGTVMGIICLNMAADYNSFLVIEDVIVDKDYRRKGIARSMLLEMEKRAKICGCSYIILVSGKLRKEAHKLYESLGYGICEAKGFRKIL